MRIDNESKGIEAKANATNENGQRMRTRQMRTDIECEWYYIIVPLSPQLNDEPNQKALNKQQEQGSLTERHLRTFHQTKSEYDSTVCPFSALSRRSRVLCQHLTESHQKLPTPRIYRHPEKSIDLIAQQ